MVLLQPILIIIKLRENNLYFYNPEEVNFLVFHHVPFPLDLDKMQKIILKLFLLLIF
jgi:hypothetical protein